MSARPLDPRSVCNAMLDAVSTRVRPPSNLALQKLLYFTHALHLIDVKVPLVSGYFEAWQYGPVNPVAYEAFKSAGSKPIMFRAMRKDPLTGYAKPAPPVEDGDILRRIDRVMSTYGMLSARQLVEVSHAPRGPWHHVVSTARDSMAFGLRISDGIIAERFKHHKVSLDAASPLGDPDEDTPFATDRSC